MMNLLLVLLMFYVLFTYGRVITINSHGNNNNDCCVYGNCPCSSLLHALKDIKSDVSFINITSSQVMLNSNVTISNHSSLEIRGKSDTVIACNNTGSVTFFNCSNITISNITWDHCGSAELDGGISINYFDALLISNCKFQHSIVYGITINATSGIINIIDTEILNNSMSSFSAGGLLVQQANENAKLHLIIINCNFSFNGYKTAAYGGGIQINTVGLTSVLNISIDNSVISNNYAYNGGGVYVYAHVNNFTMKLTDVSFIDNDAFINSRTIYLFTSGGNYASFIITNSIILGDSNNYLNFTSNVTSIVIEDLIIYHILESYMKFCIETFSNNNLTVTFFNVRLINTRVQLIINNKVEDELYEYPICCLLKFNKLIGNLNSNLDIDGSESHGFQCSITNCHFSNNHDSTTVVNIINKRDSTYFLPIIQIINSSFTNNSNGNSVVYLKYDLPSGKVNLSSSLFADNFDNDNTLYLHFCHLIISNKITFRNNAATKGGGIYFANFSEALLDHKSEMEFIDNTATLGGGAIYAEYPTTQEYTVWLLFYTTGKYTAIFINNYANAAGNSIYFNIPPVDRYDIDRNASSDHSIVYVPNQFNYSGENEIVTSPYSVFLGSAVRCANSSHSQTKTCFVENIMLGEKILTAVKMIDYFNNTAEATMFHVKCIDCIYHSLTDNFTSFIYIGAASQGVSIKGSKIEDNSTILKLQLSAIKSTVASTPPDIHIILELLMSPCHFGYEYEGKSASCVCLHFPDLVKCSNFAAKIKKGYWFGAIHHKDKSTGGYCPYNYCQYSLCEDGFCTLTCAPYRTGIACGECNTGYTLAFDSNKCIPIHNCKYWQSILVVVLTILYWIMVLVAIRVAMYFVKVEVITGYVYGIIFFYSSLDLIISEQLIASNDLAQFISALSSYFRLSPKFFVTLCLAKEMNTIDQQFIHYVHPFTAMLLLLIIAQLTSRSVRVTAILGRSGMVHSICLFLLLFYTSLSSTSWELLRPLKFIGVSEVYTYSSPSMKYFQGRHIAYGIVAILCMIVVVIGLPGLLLSEPVLRRKLTFIRLKPLLDQYQCCYKNKYHCFAAYYLICRLLILLILSLDMVELSNRYLMLQILCLVIIMIHVWVQPYKDPGLNSLDLSTLLVMLVLISLNVYAGAMYTTLYVIAPNDFIVIALVLLPLIMFVGFLFYSSKCFGCMNTGNNNYRILQRLVLYIHMYVYTHIVATYIYCYDTYLSNTTGLLSFHLDGYILTQT